MTNKLVKRTALLGSLLAGCALVLGGCASTAPIEAAGQATGVGQVLPPSAVKSRAAQFGSTFPSDFEPFMVALYRDGEWGSVLNFKQLGLAAMQAGHFEMARRAFDEAISRVEAIYADDANAAKARSVFNTERIKDFKGEPYERAMLYYYRGLLYVRENDFQNARAAFLAADRHDTLSAAEDARFAGDFGIMKYLAGWASYCDGDRSRGEQLVAEAKVADSSIASLPSPPPKAIVLIDSGMGPVKTGSGQHREKLSFSAGSPAVDLDVSLKGETGAVKNWHVAGSVDFQAATRGGRQVDAILAGKATFKDGAGAVSGVAGSVGQVAAMTGILSDNRALSNFGLAGMLIGLAAQAVEASVTPAADLRGWTSLPGSLLFAEGAGLKGPIRLESASSPGAAIPLATGGPECSLAWGRTRSALPIASGGTARIEEAEPMEDNRGERNAAFRAMLVESFSADSLK